MEVASQKSNLYKGKVIYWVKGCVHVLFWNLQSREEKERECKSQNEASTQDLRPTKYLDPCKCSVRFAIICCSLRSTRPWCTSARRATPAPPPSATSSSTPAGPTTTLSSSGWQFNVFFCPKNNPNIGPNTGPNCHLKRSWHNRPAAEIKGNVGVDFWVDLECFGPVLHC